MHVTYDKLTVYEINSKTVWDIFYDEEEFIPTIMSITERLQWAKGEDFIPEFVLCRREVTKADI